jgi:hypothetical protein
VAYLIIDRSASQAAQSAARGIAAAIKTIESLPKRDQKALLHYLDALVQENVAAG